MAEQHETTTLDVSARTINDYFNGILTPAILLTPRTNSEPSCYFSESSSVSSTAKDKPRSKIPQRIQDALDQRGLIVNEEGIVSWGSDSPIHPKQWPLHRKLYDTAVICFMQFFMTMISNVGTSIAPYATSNLNISSELAIFSFTTLYLLGQAVGGLILPPISESFGGRMIYVGSTFAFAVSSFIIAAAPNLPVVIVFRLLTGFISAMPAVVAAGTFENIWNIRGRAFAIHIWIAGSIVGLAVGPPIATFVSTSSLGWPWVFYIAGFVTVALLVLSFCMRESRPSRVLRSQVKDMAKDSNFDGLRLDSECSLPTTKAFATTSLILPVRLFFTEPIVTLTSILAATACGLVYLFSDALAVVYEDGFGFTPRQASLTNLAFAVGVIFTALPRIADAHVMNKRRRQNRPVEPEDKLFGFQVAAPVLAIGLWIFALTIPPIIADVSPWVSIAAMLLVGFAIVEFGAILAGYLCDSYTAFAASANAPMAFLRAILSGAFPLFGHQFFAGLGPNVAVFILAAVATVFCAVPVLFTVYGKQIRGKSPFAGKMVAAMEQGGEGDEEQKRPEGESVAA